jgi:hypothetical protein
MDDAQHDDDFPQLTIEQIRELAVAIREVFGGNLSRESFADKLMVVTETPEKPRRMKFVNVDTKPAKKWEELTPRQRRQELLKTPRTPKPQPIEPNPFDRDEGIIPLKPIDD